MSKTVNIKTVSEVVTIIVSGQTTQLGKSPLHSVIVTDSEYVELSLATSKVDDIYIHPINDTITIEDVLFSGDKEALADLISLSLINSDGSVIPTDFAGWEHIVDGLSTPTLSINSTPSLLTIDGLGSNSEANYLPKEILGITNLWDTTLNCIKPIDLGDSYDLRLQIEVTSSASNPTRLDLLLDIGGGVSPTIVITEQGLPLKVGVPATLVYSFPIFALGTFLANGGQLFLNTNAGSLTVGKRTLYLVRTSSVVGN